MPWPKTNKAIDRDSLNADLLDTLTRQAFLPLRNDTVHAIEAFERAARISAYPGYLMSPSAVSRRRPRIRCALPVSGVSSRANGGDKQPKKDILPGCITVPFDKSKAIAYFDQWATGLYLHARRWEKAVACFTPGKIWEASQALEKAITIQNTYDEGYYWLGRCYEKLNRPAMLY